MSGVLVIRFGGIGDIIMTTPVIRALHTAFPEAPIQVLTGPEAAPALRHHPRVSRVLVFDRALTRFPPARFHLSRALRRARHDLIVLLETGSRFRELIQGIEPARLLATPGASFTGHAVEHQLALLAQAGIPPRGRRYELGVSEVDRNWAERFMRGAGLLQRDALILIHAGSSRTSRPGVSFRKPHDLKAWPIERFQELVARLAAEVNATIAVVGTSRERDRAHAIADLMPDRCTALAGVTSFGQLMAIMERADLFIGQDSGPSHLAAALGVPQVVLFGPSDLRRVGPIHPDPERQRFVVEPTDCAPCYSLPHRHTCTRNVCMERIEAERVVEAALAVLPPSEARPSQQAVAARAAT